MNYKIVRGVIITRRLPVDLGAIRKIELDPLSRREVESYAFGLFHDRLTQEQIGQIIAVSHSNLFAIQTAYDLLQSKPFADVLKIFDGSLYSLQTGSPSEREQLIQVVRPQIELIDNTLISRLRQHPGDLYKITPRQFEEVIAELLSGMGMEVELTPATRDGGKDILAYVQTGVGKLLYLVEAKQYNPSRPVGVKLVRELYGTFMDHQANSAMLVTTSRFSPDSIEFQSRHKHQLSLKEYTDVVQWIYKHKG